MRRAMLINPAVLFLTLKSLPAAFISSLSFLFTFFLKGELFAQGEPGSRIGPGMYGCSYGLSWLGHIAIMVLWIAILAGVIFLINWLFVLRQSQKKGPGSDTSALDALKERYARGEIDKKEFEAKKRDLVAP